VSDTAIIVTLLAEWLLTVEDEHGRDRNPDSYADRDWACIPRRAEEAGVTWLEVCTRADELNRERGNTPVPDDPLQGHAWAYDNLHSSGFLGIASTGAYYFRAGPDA
jgi:hypothetical protein